MKRNAGNILKKLFESSGLKVRADKAGNVIGERPARTPTSVILLVAHLDTVFPAGPTSASNAMPDASLRRASPIMARACRARGLARALPNRASILASTIVLAGDVGEEGEGNLRGIRALVEDYGSRPRRDCRGWRFHRAHHHPGNRFAPLSRFPSPGRAAIAGPISARPIPSPLCRPRIVKFSAIRLHRKTLEAPTISESSKAALPSTRFQNAPW